MKVQSDTRPIGVFDSGVGGLSILIELQKLSPHENFVFLADQKNVPYGEKTKPELVKLVFKIADFFIKTHNIKMLVVACNTATCNTNTELRKKYKLPIVGTVPAVKPAARETKSKVIAVMSTPSTSKSKVLKDIIANFCEGIEVINIGCKSLENTVERGDIYGKQTYKLLQQYLSKISGTLADRLVLGCTHYPFLRDPIQKIVGKNVKLIDSGKAIAKHARVLLEENRLVNMHKNMGTVSYFTTGNALKFTKVASLLLKKGIEATNIRLK